MKKPSKTKSLARRCQEQLHEALGLHPADYEDFTWAELLGIVRAETAALDQVRRAVRE